jgi:inorganic pyrophosphatase
LDELSWPGCIIKCKLIGVMEATETEKNKTRRNDRLIATANASDKYNKIKDLKEMDPYLAEEIENFFNTYNNLQKKEFKVIDRKGPEVAKDLIKKQMVHANS